MLARFAAPALGGVSPDVAQASMNLAVGVALVIVGLARSRGRPDLGLSSPVMLGAWLYAAAAALGGLVALARGNEPKLLAGQLLSMGLLPLAALGGWWNGGAANLRRLALVVCSASFVMCAAAFTRGFVLLAQGLSTNRFAFADGSAPTGSAIASTFLALGLGATSTGWRRRLAYTAAATVAAYIAASSVRSLWIAAACAAACFSALAWGRSVFSRKSAVVAAVGLAAVAIAAAIAALWWGHPRPDLMRLSPGNGESRLRPAPAAVGATAGSQVVSSGAGTAVATTPAPLPAGAYRLRYRILFRHPGLAEILIRPIRSSSVPEPAGVTPVLGPEAGSVAYWRVVVTTAPAAALEVRLAETGGAASGFESVTLERLGPPWLGSLIAHIDQAVHRPPDPNATSGSGPFAGDASIAFRLRESESAINGFLRAGWGGRLLGHGLGARLDLTAAGYDREGSVMKFERPNYIHNFYLFLLFKLGIVGTVVVGAALLLWTLTPAEAALRHPPGDPARVMLAACAAVWVGYSVWAAAAPEILDFRQAALWGLVLSATPLHDAGPGGSSKRAESASEGRRASLNAGGQAWTGNQQ